MQKRNCNYNYSSGSVMLLARGTQAVCRHKNVKTLLENYMGFSLVILANLWGAIKLHIKHIPVYAFFLSIYLSGKYATENTSVPLFFSAPCGYCCGTSFSTCS